MTRKKQPNTLQARYGFMDNDLKTRSHDEIMQWLNDNAGSVCEKLLSGEYPKKHEFVDSEYKATHEIAGAVQIQEIIWEHPITTGGTNKYTVGFVDLYVYCAIPVYSYGTHHDGEAFSDKRLTSHVFYFEVKSKIESLGELIRQIRYYQEYIRQTDTTHYVVVAPYTSFETTLKSQNILFVEAFYEDNSKAQQVAKLLGQEELNENERDKLRELLGTSDECVPGEDRDLEFEDINESIAAEALDKMRGSVA